MISKITSRKTKDQYTEHLKWAQCSIKLSDLPKNKRYGCDDVSSENTIVAVKQYFLFKKNAQQEFTTNNSAGMMALLFKDKKGYWCRLFNNESKETEKINFGSLLEAARFADQKLAKDQFI